MYKRAFLLLSIILMSCNNESSHKLFDFGNTTFSAPVYAQFKNDIKFSVAKVPNEYFLNQYEYDSEQTDSLSYNDVFIYEFLANDLSDLMETKSNLDYDSVVQHMSQQIYEDFIGIDQNGDKIPCIGVTHERTFQVRPQERLILYFKRNNDSPINQIIYTDRLYDSGQVIHTLKEGDIKL